MILVQNNQLFTSKLKAANKHKKIDCLTTTNLLNLNNLIP